MRTFRTDRDQLVIFVIKVSTVLILCFLLLNALNVRAQFMPNGYDIGQGKNLREKVRKIYTSQIGIREKPSNSGPQVEKYLKYVGLSKGQPWCAAFVCWVFGEAGISNPRSGWSPALFGERFVIWGKGVESGKLKGESVHRFAYPITQPRGGAAHLAYSPTQTSDFRPPSSNKPTISSNLPTPTSDFQFQTSPRAFPPRLATDNWQLTTIPFANKRLPPNPPTPTTGDIFGLYFPEKGRVAHTGFIDQWDGTWMISVEGNTNVAGSREGDGVYRKRRLVRSVYQVARYINH